MVYVLNRKLVVLVIFLMCFHLHVKNSTTVNNMPINSRLMLCFADFSLFNLMTIYFFRFSVEAIISLGDPMSSTNHP